MMRRIDIDSPLVDLDVNERLFSAGELYTGEAVEYVGEQIVALDVYVDGLLNGMSRQWFNDGSLRGEGAVVEGRPTGEHKEWHANGQLAARRMFDATGWKLISEETWNEEGERLTSWTADSA
ncbi:toxin-antitoxin system YwqK family antitoxin [Streptomyces chumphonensis]|uniref:toxin-antitoxin system YwqK family antitoxin n=1 Tax=Streptomyces chumphonensis TaxID=1214925 RepID=UPI003D72E42D